MTTTGPTTNAGWYPDPTTPGRIRYWDGTSWTQHSLEAPPAQTSMWNAPGSTKPLSQTRRSSPWWRRWWAITIGAVAILLVIGALSDSSSDPASPKSPTSAVAPTSSPSETHQEAPKRTSIPVLKGMTVVEVRQELRRDHLKVGYIERRPSALPVGTVLSQGLRGGKHVAYGSTVPLVVAAPLPRVPAVTGRIQSVAAAALRAAGFRVLVSHRITTSGTDGVVLSQSPLGGRAVRPHILVTIVVAHVVRPVVAAPPTPPPSSNCTPGYSPCLAPAYDYDCAGGSGDGPKYVYGTVRVTGSDPYGLDADNDGYGCD